MYIDDENIAVHITVHYTVLGPTVPHTLLLFDKEKKEKIETKLRQTHGSTTWNFRALKQAHEKQRPPQETRDSEKLLDTKQGSLTWINIFAEPRIIGSKTPKFTNFWY